jgi:phenylalanyl-tRNA synthetase alpha subunit
MRAAFEQLQVQLALGWAEGRDAYAAQKQKIQDSIGAFEAEVDRASAAADQKTREALDGLKREFVARADALDAELTAVEVQYVEEKDKVKAEWASQKQAVEEQIEKFRAELEAKGQAASEKLEKFDGELTESVSQLKKAFTNLFS